MAAGRHRAFDKEKALEAAMLVFWRNGYVGTSLANLTQAMGINKPSLYATFGNKEQLFVTALERYGNQYALPAFEYLLDPEQPLAHRLEAHLKAVARVFCHPDLPTGCLMANSTCESASDNLPPAILNLISTFNSGMERRLFDFFAQEQAKGTISNQSSPRALALHLISVNSGMAILARNGATLPELDEMIIHVVSTLA